MVALSVAFYARLSVGSRQIVEIFNILNEFMGNVFGKVPAYTTIGYWTQELGLSVYKESCSLFKDKRYALIVDESMMIGSEKLLLGENGAFPPTRDGCIHSLSMRKRG